MKDLKIGPPSKRKASPSPKDEKKNPTPNRELADDELSPLDIDVMPKSDIFGVPHRFNIMMILYNYERIGFTALRKTLSLSSGNLEHHLQKLIALGWVEPFSVFSFRLLQYYQITEKGKSALKTHAEKLKKLLESL